MLGMGLVLFTVKSIRPNLVWPGRALAIAFWSINLGLAAMVLLSVLPVGLMQTWASVETGYWYARSSEFLHSGPMETLRWMRVFGDTVFAAGVVTFVGVVAKLTLGRRAQSLRGSRTRSSLAQTVRETPAAASAFPLHERTS